MGRHRKREAEYHNKKDGSQNVEVIALTEDKTYEQILIHEILDLLPFTLREEALTVLLSGDGRATRRVGRLIREHLPQQARE